MACKIILIMLSAFCLPHLVFSQDFSISGHLKDTSANFPHSNAVVSIIKQADSSLVKFTRSDPAGNFHLEGLRSGDYILLVTYPDYADYVQKFELKDNTGIDFKQILLIPKAKLMEEIILKRTAITIKGDTTEYRADSFRVKPNATVEDLLKELPGIQVDKDGRITAQGQRVHRLLVDGEEFFSDDPTISTRNLRADAIDKVQVFDKKSDQSAFTGIDDGEKTKTINLELKADAKKGYFGKIAAAGSDENYNGQAFANSFRGKRKLSAFAIVSNTDKTGLDFTESMSYGFDNDGIEVDEGSGTIFINSGTGDALGIQNYAGEGLPESIKGGLHYSNKWKQDVFHTSGNYLFNNLVEKGANNVFRQNILQDSVYYTRDNSTRHSDQVRHTLSGLFETQLDASSSLKMTFNGYAGKFDQSTDYDAYISGQEDLAISRSSRNLNQRGESLFLNATALYRKKFKKPGKTLSLNVGNQYHESYNQGYLLNESSFYSNLTLTKQDSTDQHKRNTGDQNIFNAKVTYTEPLSDKSFLEVNYTFRNNHSKMKWLSFNKDTEYKYSILVDSLSDYFDYNYDTHSAGMNYRFNEKKYYFSLGGNLSGTHVTQKNLFKDSVMKYDYLNFSPQIVFNYKFNPYSNFNIKYTGQTIQPTIQQLQPLKNNYDPMNLIIGNPLLQQEFENGIQITYSNYQVLNERYLFLSSFLIHTANMISNSYFVDGYGRKITQYINVDDAFAASFGGGYSLKIPKSSVRIAFGPALNYSTYSNVINGDKNTTTTTSLALRMNARMNQAEAYELYATVIPTYNKSQSTISEVSTTSFTNYSFNVGGNVTLPSKFEIGSDLNINIREKINQYDLNNNVVLWDAYVEKKFLKNEVLSLRLSIKDILDQNKGYSRYQHPFYYEERNYLTLRRYWLIGLTYHFINKGGKVAAEDGTIRL